jgi:hypothetical protein
MRALSVHRGSRLKLQHGCLVMFLFASTLVVALPPNRAIARTRPVVEMGDPDIGNEKPRSGQSAHAATLQTRKGTLRDQHRWIGLGARVFDVARLLRGISYR